MPSDQDRLVPIKSFRMKKAERQSPTTAATLAWDDFFDVHDPIIRSVVRRRELTQYGINDMTQEVWAPLMRTLP